ncbi:hypothetical protein [Actinomadura madurae]|uniref:hypothetical protein n=1 Tax=Actinomadura madurae TaxID=1993 RepID=UPI0020D23051|nr:hypothetical protein [Actinomadura madurae]MCP9984740.1 hypothetical protein [Actinomadura madurae]MCQ0020930.1 hypothetical protein [Actinomadura madurae]
MSTSSSTTTAVVRTLLNSAWPNETVPPPACSHAWARLAVVGLDGGANDEPAASPGVLNAVATTK